MSELKHFGVLGMRWGRRKAVDNRPDILKKGDLRVEGSGRLLKATSHRKENGQDVWRYDQQKEKISSLKKQPVKNIPKKSILSGKTRTEKVLLVAGGLVLADIAAGTLLSAGSLIANKLLN